MSPTEFRKLAMRAARKLRQYADIDMDSFYQPSQPESGQDGYWREGRRNYRLAQQLLDAAKNQAPVTRPARETR